MKRLILVRHGNTFGPKDRVCWVGARTDLPLVDYGVTQAKAVGATLAAQGIKPDHIFAGPLLRTKQTADYIADALDFTREKISITSALREIDYGTWEGLANNDIRARYGDTDIDDWQQKAIWPRSFDWSPSPEDIVSSWEELVASFEENQTAIIVSSNGIFKVLAALFGIEPENSKVGTGCYCVVELSESVWVTRGWSRTPRGDLA